jgi:hypothetical protein
VNNVLCGGAVVDVSRMKGVERLVCRGIESATRNERPIGQANKEVMRITTRSGPVRSIGRTITGERQRKRDCVGGRRGER